MKTKGLSEEFIEKVKTSNNIVSVVLRYLPLKQRGKNYWGNCPFHHEKTASFAINEHQQFFKCFGCGASGNVINFVKQVESTDFLGAVELMAKWAGLTMPTVKIDAEYAAKRKLKDRALDILEFAREFYCTNLYQEKNKHMLEYLYGRGINDELIKAFSIGASDSWNELTDKLLNKGYTTDELMSSGVAAKSDRGNVYDAMRGRITFAVFDIYDSCIGFTGRSMLNDVNVAKYRNTSQTIVFDKGSIVYGVNVLKKNKLSNFVDRLIVVEGNVDVITLVGAGFTNTVACMGTAMTAFHARVFKRFSPNIYLCFDGDKAGKAAALKNVDILAGEGLNVRVVTLPDDIDPDNFLVKNGKHEFQTLLDSAKPMIDYKLDELEKVSDLKGNDGRTKYFKSAVEIVKRHIDGAEAELYVPKISKHSGISTDAVLTAIKAGATKAAIAPSFVALEKHIGNKFSYAEAFVVASVLHGRIQPNFDKLRTLDIKNSLYRKILDIIERRQKDGKWRFDMVFDELDDDERDAIKELIDYEFVLGSTQLEKFYNDCETTLEQGILKRMRDELQQRFSATTQNEERLRLAGEISNLNKRIKKC